MADGTREEFDTLYHRDAQDHENAVQPPASRVRGAAGFWATAQWLRAAFPDLHYDVRRAVVQDDLVVVSSTMIGTHSSVFAFHRPSGEVDSAFPATGKPFEATQSHWFRLEDGLIREHWANRDDMGMAKQLGWLPPTPAYVVRMGLATRRARRTAQA